jgi:glycine/D-amino acid oxidase-like deaminating enzyme
VRVLIAGGGLAGSLLAWRLAQQPGTQVELITGRAGRPKPRPVADATAASGGAVRAYDALPEQRELAIASLVELLASPVLRDWASYRQTGFAYLRAEPADGPASGPAEIERAVAEIERALPGSAELTSPAEAFGDQADGPGWAGDEAGDGDGARVVVRERRAGYTSPGRLRDAVLADLAARSCAVLRDATLDSAAGSADGNTAGYDAVVLAAGAWTPALLRASGRPADGYRTRSIQYTVYDAGPVRPTAFADERTGLYGLPTADGGLLLGLPTTEWDVPPGAAEATLSLHEAAARLAAGCFPRLKLGEARQRVAGVDCYCDPPVLALREVSGQPPRLFTFTGGSGGAAKSALAASLRAAHQLTDLA